MTETIGMVFSMVQKGVLDHRYLTTVALEHIFGKYHTEKREVTVLEYFEIKDKRGRRKEAIHAGKFKVSRDRKKWYSATYAPFVESS